LNYGNVTFVTYINSIPAYIANVFKRYINLKHYLISAE